MRQKKMDEVLFIKIQLCKHSYADIKQGHISL